MTNKFVVRILKREKHWTLKFYPYVEHLGNDPAEYYIVPVYVYVDLRKTDENELWGGFSISSYDSYPLEDIDNVITLWQFVKDETEKVKQEFIKS